MQLEKGVEGHELDAGLGEDVIGRHHGKGTLIAIVSAHIAIVVRHRQHGFITPQKDVVHAPRVRAEALNGHAARRDLREAGLQFLEHPQQVPAYRAADGHRAIWETVDLLDGELVTFQRPQHHSSALSAQITCKVVVDRHFLLVLRFLSCSALRR